MKNARELILSFESTSRVSDAEVMPLLCHAVLEHISAKSIHEFLTGKGVKVAARRIRSLRKQAAEWLGFYQTKPGRISKQELEKLHSEWHSIYGYPTLEMLVNGWKPAREFAEKSGAETTPDKTQEPTQEDTLKSLSKSPSKTPPKIDLNSIKHPEKKPFIAKAN